MIKIDKKIINNSSKTYIIAEIGLAHEGSVGIAKSFISKASDCGADAVKFQMHIPEYESSKFEKFRKKFSSQDKNRFDYWKRTSFTFSQWKIIAEFCKKKKINFLCSPFSNKAVDDLLKLKVTAWKIASGEFNNLYMLNYIISKSNKPIILSTGLTYESEIKKVLRFLKRKNLILLQCTSKYPTKIEEQGHNLIYEFKKKFKVLTGSSDHTGSLNSLISSIALDASVIETHVTFDKGYFGPDNNSSILFSDLKKLVNFNNEFQLIKNSKIKKINLTKKQKEMRKLFCKSLVLKKDLKKNKAIKIDDIEVLKPLKGIPSENFQKIIGKKFKTNKKKDDFINYNDLKK
tara:strand:- start:31 stop:1068 length:1038 start_codon:yes stop_codon:yes gene_type:complete